MSIVFDQEHLPFRRETVNPLRIAGTPKQPGYTTKSAWVYAQMKDDIARGVLAPGERLVVSLLARQYNVSPMPVRDALNRLCQDGFVEITPHAGASVAAIGLGQLYQIMVIRQELEALAASLAVPNIDSSMLQRLENMHKKMEAFADHDNKLDYEQLNWDFHEAIYACCDNQALYDLVMSLWRRSCITRTVFVRLPNQLQLSVAKHRQWLDAQRLGDVNAVRSIVREHIKSTTDRLNSVITGE